MVKMTLAIATLLALCNSQVCRAADICQAIALRDVSPIGDAKSVIRKGQVDDAITEFRVDKFNGETSFCSHGGYCFPTHINIGGASYEALKLTNCSINRGKPYEEEQYLIYGLDPIRSQIPPEQLRIEDLDNRFLALGLCSACSSTVATLYVQRPHSRCGVLAKNALEGNPDAIRTLQADPDYCH